jgi:hypothetical protein
MTRTVAWLWLVLLLTACATSPDAGAASASGHACPSCHEQRLVPVLYGYLNAEGAAAVERREAVAGGCGWPGPAWMCLACGHQRMPQLQRFERDELGAR